MAAGVVGAAGVGTPVSPLVEAIEGVAISSISCENGSRESGDVERITRESW